MIEVIRKEVWQDFDRAVEIMFLNREINSTKAVLKDICRGYLNDLLSQEQLQKHKAELELNLKYLEDCEKRLKN